MGASELSGDEDSMGTIAPKRHTKLLYKTWVKTGRSKHIVFRYLLCKRGVTGSIPVTSTNFLKELRLSSCNFYPR
jgi:hypothetical protein